MPIRYLVCITGASGGVYAVRLMSALAARGVILHVVASEWGARVLLEETGRPLGYWLGKLRTQGGPDGGPALITLHDNSDFSAPVASGSFRLCGTVIAPCSMGTLGAISSGICSNLIHRAGAVALKEGWPFIVVPRETPLSLVSIRAMSQLKEAGAVILPASPSFYGKPKDIESLVDTVVYRILDHLGIVDKNVFRWSREES
ncbi:putative aromatic acid decarboxylase [uncultured spirochete]|uniref:Flavin prenyltransferase UbiX n=1 Tax=uncultured spirochete TaxID=156406 RepID=A0A3P3XMQ9_9SPIR|nr:putative aromatic acid decarboxylase [uncultured spirochete]